MSRLAEDAPYVLLSERAIILGQLSKGPLVTLVPAFVGFGMDPWAAEAQPIHRTGPAKCTPPHPGSGLYAPAG